jgi:hypothetical protein
MEFEKIKRYFKNKGLEVKNIRKEILNNMFIYYYIDFKNSNIIRIINKDNLNNSINIS